MQVYRLECCARLGFVGIWLYLRFLICCIWLQGFVLHYLTKLSVSRITVSRLRGTVSLFAAVCMYDGWATNRPPHRVVFLSPSR